MTTASQARTTPTMVVRRTVGTSPRSRERTWWAGIGSLATTIPTTPPSMPIMDGICDSDYLMGLGMYDYLPLFLVDQPSSPRNLTADCRRWRGQAHLGPARVGWRMAFDRLYRLPRDLTHRIWGSTSPWGWCWNSLTPTSPMECLTSTRWRRPTLRRSG